MNQDLGKLIRFLRKRAGMSQAVLAKQLFVEQSSISRWENGSLQVDVTILQQLSEIFEIPLQSFYQPNQTFAFKGNTTTSNLLETTKAPTDNYPVEDSILPADSCPVEASTPSVDSQTPTDFTIGKSPAKSYRTPLYLKLVIAGMALIIGILGSIIYVQNMTYTPLSYLVANDRYVYDSFHDQEVYEIAYIYKGLLTERKSHEFMNDLTIFWLTYQAPSDKEDIYILKANCYKDVDTAEQWGEPRETFYIYNRNKWEQTQ